MSKTVPFELRTAAVADAGDIARVYIASGLESYRGIVTEATLEGMSLGRELTNTPSARPASTKPAPINIHCCCWLS